MEKTQTRKKRIAVILEAAGDARRFGSNKLLHPLGDGKPMISSILSVIDDLAAACDDVYKKILVTQYDEVAEMASDYNIVKNHHPELGISLSMQLGIETAGDVDAYMFCVCDQPFLTCDTLKALIDAYNKGSHGIISLSWKGQMYNPKIFSSIYKDELMSLSGDTGGRQIIAAHKDELLLVEASCEAEIIDIDTPQSSHLTR